MAGFGRGLCPAHITTCLLAAPEEVGAQRPDPGTLCCLPQSWEGRPARAGHSQPQHSHPEVLPIKKFSLFFALRFFSGGLNFHRLNADVFMSEYPALAVVAPMAEPGQVERRQRRPGGASSGSTRWNLGSWPTHGWSRDPPPFHKLPTHSPMDTPTLPPVLKVTWGRGRQSK